MSLKTKAVRLSQILASGNETDLIDFLGTLSHKAVTGIRRSDRGAAIRVIQEAEDAGDIERNHTIKLRWQTIFKQCITGSLKHIISLDNMGGDNGKRT